MIVAWRLLAATLICVGLADAQGQWSYRIDFNAVPVGRVAAGEGQAIMPPGAAFGHVSAISDAAFTDEVFCEVADGTGPDGSRALRFVDRSDAQSLHGFFRVLVEGSPVREALTVGALRFDLCFAELPSRPFTLGRRNFGILVGSDGRLLGPAGLDEPPWGRRADFVRDWFRFREGVWYSLLFQYDAAGDPDHAGGGAYSVFARRWDGSDHFNETDLIVRGATYVHNQHDSWGRLVEPRYGAREATAVWLLDNFALDDGTGHHLAAGRRPRTALLNPAFVRVAADAGPETVKGAQELVQYLGRATGISPRLIRGEENLNPDEQGIEVGTSRAQALTAGLLDGAKSEDAFAIVARDGVCAVAGATDLATRYGCGEFLERFVGVRWYMPGEFGEVVPRLTGLRVPEVEIMQEPAFWHRWCSGVLCDFGDVGTWLARLRMRPTIQFHHNLLRIFDVRKYGQTEPELYPLIDGERYIPAPGAHDWQPCLSNPRAVEITMEYAREQFAAGASSISLGINDSQRYCECPECMKFVRPDEPRAMRRTRWFLHYANEVARRVAAEFPGKLVGYLAYGETLDIPDDVHAEPNLVPFLVNKSADLNPDGVLDLSRWQTPTPSSERLEAWHAMIERTQRHFPRWALYDWYFGAGRKAAPNLHYDAVSHYLRFGAAHGCVGVYVESYPNWGLDGHKYWFYYKALWDPSFDPREALEEFYVRFFGPAADPMRRYCEAVERLTFVDGAGPETLDPYTSEAVAACQALLDEALASVRGADVIYRARVRYYADAFGLTAILAARWHAAVAARRALDAQAPLAEVIRALAPGWGADRDVDLYCRWVLSADRYQFRRPGSRHLSQYPSVFAAVAGRLVTEAQARAQAAGVGVEAARRELVQELRAALADDERALSLLDALARAPG